MLYYRINWSLIFLSSFSNYTEIVSNENSKYEKLPTYSCTRCKDGFFLFMDDSTKIEICRSCIELSEQCSRCVSTKCLECNVGYIYDEQEYRD